MKKLLIPIFCMFSIACIAQKDSIAVFRFIYELKDANYPERSFNECFALDIQPNQVSAFDNITYKNKEVLRQLPSITQSDLGKTIDCLYKNLPESGQITFVKSQPDNFIVTENMTVIDWTLTDETREVCGYQCKKAEGDVCGRYWTVWYAEELPMNNGPWKLGGLPGLILEASDAENIFHFTCIGMEQRNIAPIAIMNKKFLRCTNIEYQKQLRERNADPVSYDLKKMGYGGVKISKVTIMDSDGNPMDELPESNIIYIEKLEGDKR